MRKIFGRAVFVGLLALVTMPLEAKSQNVYVIERTERLTIVEYNDVVLKVSLGSEKRLPEGYMHFTPVVRPLQIQSNGVVICREMGNAISFGKRLWLGHSLEGAVEDMRQARGGDIACGYRGGITLVSSEVAIRGDDAGRRVHIVKWRGSDGNEYFTGVPCRTRTCF